MTREKFRELCLKQVVLLDGATGSNLIKHGMDAGVCPETWILEHKEVLMNLQREYVENGSNIVYAPTFTANRIKLGEYQLADQIEEINTKLVQISKEAIGDKGFVAGDITMTGEQLIPMGTMEFEELIMIYKEQIKILAKAGVDLIVIETMMSLQETRAAIIAAKEVCDLPIIVTMTFEPDGRTLFGTDAMTAAIVCESLGVDAFGLNCSTGPDKMIPLLKEMANVTTIPLIAKPNAGIPTLLSDGSTGYDLEAKPFGEQMKMLVDAGATIVGGCCGTTPEHILHLYRAVKDKKVVVREKSKKRYVTSERKCVEFSLNDPFMIVGERINPTGKKKLQEQLRNYDFEMVTSFAEEQESKGASILDVNMGMSGIDESKAMCQALVEISQVTNLPLSIDSSHVAVCEEALRNYPGRALLNSISMEEEKITKLLPIAKKYGAMFILLPLSDSGLPKDLSEKIEIINTIVDKAMELGFTKEDIVVDGLVTTVGANKLAALETLETIEYCKNNGLATTCGLSNISFGLPERGMVNTAFLTMAIQKGLTMAIANPDQELLTCAAFASDLLLNKENSDIRYIEKMNETTLVTTNTQKKDASNAVLLSSDEKSGTILEDIFQCVLKGKRKQIEELTKDALSNHHEAKEILDVALLPAINKVGEFFDIGTYFLPQLIASAETMKVAIEYLEPLLLTGNEDDSMPVVVIATVEGDIHDIGKNLVALMLKNHGFKVYDLGKDVKKEEIVKKALEVKADIICMSALMTTTMLRMKDMIEYLEEKQITIKTMIGGAVITEEYAREIGASAYSKDAAEAVVVAKKLCNL
ncbi:MAG: homocysteine S-methyltransferase family protein [Lachnospiraceae bacterium]